ncbi:MAG: hypothetical protein IKQ75_04250 [Bacteroidales bacterium]|nr:hypothetical protein [Bacteroidales bacterium]
MNNTTAIDYDNLDLNGIVASLREANKQTQEITKLMKETALRQKETDRLIKENAEQLKETDRQLNLTSQRVDKLYQTVSQHYSMYTSNWGKLIEALAKPACLELFKQQNIGITQVYQEARKGEFPNGSMEVDVILCNTTVAVVVEVKTTCKVKDVDYFLEQMNHFKEAFHPFAQYTVYPAVAAIKYDEDSDKYAFRQGLFVLQSTGKDLFTLKAPEKLKEY